MENFYFQFPCENNPIQYFDREKFEFLHKWHRNECQPCFKEILKRTADQMGLTELQFSELLKDDNFLKNFK